MVINNQYWIEDFYAFWLIGKDSRRFLNGITTSEIIHNSNKVFRTCWLTPTGNLRSLLEIYSSEDSEQKLLIVVLQGDVNEVRQYLSDMIFPPDDINVGAIFSTSRFQEIDEIYSWRDKTSKLLNEEQKRELLRDHAINVMNESDLQQWKIIQALPIYGSEIDGKNNPLELGLTDLIDFNKGCYLGQETIAKLKNVASLKHEIRVWSCTKPSKKFVELINNKIFFNAYKEKVVGLITSFGYLKSEKAVGLAMIKRNYLKQNDSFFSDQFGEINVSKSIASVFL